MTAPPPPATAEYFPAAASIPTLPLPAAPSMAVDQLRMGIDQSVAVAHTPATTKKIKLEAASPPPPGSFSYQHSPARYSSVDDKAIQTAEQLPFVAATADSNLAGSAPRSTADPPSLQSIRTTIDEQFSIEIILKHRELGDIEKEIAKTQVALEQLRRCSLVPYADSTEAQLHAQLNYTPPAANPDNIPDFAPPPEGVVDGPYTRHYRQWLISHQRFDGLGAPAYLTPPPLTPGVAMNGMHQSLSGSGRPQRQSAMKVQTKNGEQVCLFRRRDGVLVRLECRDCHRSNFSSAQGFINHCRIAHQTEYASHDLAADACGQEVNEEEQAALVSPMFRAAIDGPARNTRQTQQQQTPALPTPRASFSDHSANKNSAPRQMPTPASTAQRKGGRRATMTVNTPKTPAPQSKLASSSTTSPMDFRTSNLESHLKRKRPDINVETLLKEVTETRAAWERMGSFETESSEDESSKNFNNYGFDPRPTPPQMGYHKPPVVQMTPPLASRPPTPTSQEPAGFSRHSMSGMTPHVQARAHHMSADGDTEMHDCDASSSDDDDGGYRSDGGNDDELYTVPTRRPMQGEALEFRNGESSTFGPMLSGSNSGSGLFTQYLPPSPTPAFNPGLMSGFAHGGTALLNGGGIAPMALPTPSVTINPAVLMMDTTGGHSAPSPTMLSMAAALFNNTQMQHQYPQYEPEVPKHVRFAIPGIGGEGLRKEGVN